jgi:hypothetical protein
MPMATVQKYPRVAQDDTILILSMEVLLGHFDHIAETAARLADQEARALALPATSTQLLRE